MMVPGRDIYLGSHPGYPLRLLEPNLIHCVTGILRFQWRDVPLGKGCAGEPELHQPCSIPKSKPGVQFSVHVTAVCALYKENIKRLGCLSHEAYSTLIWSTEIVPVTLRVQRLPEPSVKGFRQNERWCVGDKGTKASLPLHLLPFHFSPPPTWCYFLTYILLYLNKLNFNYSSLNKQNLPN